MPTQRCDRGHVALSLIAVVAVTSYTTIAPVLPLEIYERGIIASSSDDGDDDDDGGRGKGGWVLSMIFLSTTFGSLLSPTFASRYFASAGTANVISLSLAGMALSFWSLGRAFAFDPVVDPSSYPSPPPDVVARGAWTAVTILVVAQFFVGATFSAVSTGYYSLTTLIFLDGVESAMSCVEMACGIGYILGPALGSALYDAVGYESTYAAISLGLLAMSVVTWKYLAPILRYEVPEFANDESESDADSSVALLLADGIGNYDAIDGSEDYVDVAGGGDDPSTMTHAMTHPRQPSAVSILVGCPSLILASLTMCWIDVSWSLFEPLLAVRLRDRFRVGTGEIGIIFSCSSIFYVPAVYLSRYLPNRGIRRHATVSISVLLTSMTVMLMGSDSFPVLMVGVATRGMLQAPVWVHLLPWMQEASARRFPDPHHAQTVNDLTASLYNSSMKLGQIVGYGIGPFMSSHGFTRTTQAIALLVCFQSVLFYFGAGDFNRGKGGI
jgi:predicted MFS family arabinose efflux permease